MAIDSSVTLPGLGRVQRVSLSSGLAATAASALLAFGTCAAYVLMGWASVNPACSQYLVYSSAMAGVVGFGMAETYGQLPGTRTRSKVAPVVVIAFVVFASGELLPAVSQLMTDLSLGIGLRLTYFALAAVVSVGAATLAYGHGTDPRL